MAALAARHYTSPSFSRPGLGQLQKAYAIAVLKYFDMNQVVVIEV
jgi:hypothetical protein